MTRTTPKTKILARNRAETLEREANAGFFKAPMGSKLCACGKKPEYHEFCGECWEDHGREKVTAEAEREQAKLKQEMKTENIRLEKMWKLFRPA